MNASTRLVRIVFAVALSWNAIAQQAPGQTPGAAPGTAPAGQQGRRPPIQPAELSVRSHSVSVAGRLEPRSRTTHLTEAAGYIQAVMVREGQAITASQPLFSIQRTEVGQTFKPVVTVSRVDGVVSQVLLQVNDEVKSGEAAVVVVSTDRYTLNAAVSDKDAFKVPVGQKVVGRSPDGKELSGTLTSRSQEPDYATGLFSLTFDFPRNPGASVGTMLIIELPIDQSQGIYVRRDLVVRRYGKFFLWVVGPGNVLESREVRLGEVYGEEVRIAAGLTVGERYLTRLTGRERAGAALGAPGN